MVTRSRVFVVQEGWNNLRAIGIYARDERYALYRKYTRESRTNPVAMQKAMFNNPFGLTQLVIDEKKQLTRRAMNVQPPTNDCVLGWRTDNVKEGENFTHAAWFCGNIQATKWFKPRWKVGEIVAVAQSYFNVVSKDVHFVNKIAREYKHVSDDVTRLAGWNNKMFVKAALMPYQIKILSVRVERLQDISNEDCMREGIYSTYEPNPQVFGYEGVYYQYMIGKNRASEGFNTPKQAFASLIDKVGKKGDWEKNSYVWVYEFELLK